MSVQEKLAKLNEQLKLAGSMVQASDPNAAASEQRSITALIQRITADVTLKHYAEAAKVARELHRAVLKLQAAWAMGESSATGRVLTHVETLAADIAAELQALAQKKP
jgi:hypothetical protein